MKIDKKLLEQHVTQYIAEVYADSLTDAGFVCPNDNLLCWYRLQSDEIVNSFIFYSKWSRQPVLLSLEYGITPLFEMPVHIKSFTFNEQVDEEILTHPLFSRREGAKTIFLDNVRAYVPYGSRTLEVLLPEMNRIQTIEEAYNYYKDCRLNDPMAKNYEESRYGRYGVLSKTMINMALWVDDKEMYPHAVFVTDEKVALFEKICKRHPRRTACRQELASWQRLQTVLNEGSRDNYIAELSRRIEENTQLVKEQYLCLK